MENPWKTSSLNTQLSLVAVEKGRVVGHIFFSLINKKKEREDVPALALAPMAVHPESQNQGNGSELVMKGLGQCQNLGHKIVLVVGHPHYYSRFGLVPARKKRGEAPFPVPDEAFMVKELFPGSLNGTTGMVEYPPESDGVRIFP